MEVTPVIIFGILVFLAHLFAGIFSRTKIPDVLLLFIIGILLGPLSGIATPTHFGKVGPVFTTITLVIILFESGIGLPIDSLRKAMRRTLLLTTLNFFATMVIIGITVSLSTELDPKRAFMLSAIVGGTSPAVVIPLIKQLKMQDESRTILILESGIGDVLCIVFAIAFLEAHKFGKLRFGVMVGQILASFSMAVFFGCAGGFLWSILLNRVRTIQNSLFTTPAFVFVVFGIVELLGFSGAIASLAFGITLANIELLNFPFLKRYVPHEPIALNETEKVFFSEVVFLLKTFFFVYIGLFIQLKQFWWFYFGFMLTILVFILRFFVVRFSVYRTTPIEDASLMAAMVPKGLATAALASIPLQQGILGGEFIQNVAYAVVLFSIVLTSLLVFLHGKRGSFNEPVEATSKNEKN